ncbi:MAG: hypothetical protein U9O06_04830 [Euryarchaeota archaeon]|nr:hypothetical protein [Euryarchaeota archaeon]
MAPEMRSGDTWSFRGGREILEKKGLLNELPEIAAAYKEHGGGNQNMTARGKRLDPLDWQQEISIKYELRDMVDGPSRRGSFDAYKNGVLVEHEKGEQMRANWHLMKMEAAYRDSMGFSGDEYVDAGALLIPSYVNFPTLGRTENDVRAFLANYFDFSIPLFVWEYPSE